MKPAGESSMSRNDDDAKYRGVRKRKWGKWVSEIRLPNSRERIWLGSYDSPEKAARAFDAALFCLRGNTANFNFPDQPPNIPGGTDLHPSQIQAVAADFANSSSSSSSHGLQELAVSNNSYDQTSISMDFHTSSHDQSSFLIDEDNILSHIPDYGIFPGFDDYFMQPPLTVDYGEEVNYDGVYSQDPSFLWNF